MNKCGIFSVFNVQFIRKCLNIANIIELKNTENIPSADIIFKNGTSLNIIYHPISDGVHKNSYSIKVHKIEDRILNMVVSKAFYIDLSREDILDVCAILGGGDLLGLRRYRKKNYSRVAMPQWNQLKYDQPKLLDSVDIMTKEGEIIKDVKYVCSKNKDNQMINMFLDQNQKCYFDNDVSFWKSRTF